MQLPSIVISSIIKLRRAVLSQIPSELLSIISLIIILCSGILFTSNHSFFSFPSLLKWFVFVWWQRFLASGFMTLFIVPSWSTILPLAEVKKSPFDSSRICGRIVFITGGSAGGIGFAAAEALLLQGYSVIVSSRGLSMSQTAMLRKLKEAAGLREDQVYFPTMLRHTIANMQTTHRLAAVDLDLDSEESIRGCVQRLSDLLTPHNLKLYCLVNNAGAAAQPPSPSTLRQKYNIVDPENDLTVATTADSGENNNTSTSSSSVPNNNTSIVSCSLGGLEKNIGSNFVGPLLLTDLLIARGLLFVSSSQVNRDDDNDDNDNDDDSRAVHVASIGHQFTTTFFGSWNRKFFLEQVLGQCWSPPLELNQKKKKKKKRDNNDQDDDDDETENARQQLLATRHRQQQRSTSPSLLSSTTNNNIINQKIGIIKARSSISVFCDKTIDLVSPASSPLSSIKKDARAQLFYCDSKLCNALTASAMSREKTSKHHVHHHHHYSVSPGIAMTAFFRFTFLSKISPFLQKCVHAVASIVAKFPKEGAASTLHCVTNENGSTHELSTPTTITADDDDTTNAHLVNGGYYSDAVYARGRLVVNGSVVYHDAELARGVVQWGRKMMSTNVASDSGSV